MRKFVLALALAVLCVAQAGAQTLITPQIPNSLCNLTAVVAISSATTTELVPSQVGSTPVICFAYLPAGGTNPTIKFQYGTKTSTPCDTNPTNLSGTIVGQAAAPAMGAGAFAILTGPVGTELCLVTSGTPSIQGWIFYGYRNQASPFIL